ncbi:hypothetical protein SFBM_0101 [Candidatus Arthromitus sp. SFB-mouse-Japan]|uniref:hypothetical protein n=1 Tax=Candidatus Arthromitus sp. SFB-mouse TaxID=49118 RepID=UPI00021B8082|nr:hypothetical protein [Candidatus Arthromitus sp. SFB-mouse]EIA22152.1 hypothetical protein SFB2_270G3 [Candidatus Arthromitus sp. SFB-2]EIA23444.1 hypothetical protein SFB1_163G10 [Candidatus Arthromitus sp. SFB-1]EIA28095.1 hypothetical protein SFB6_068G9 [Candidatus Arthromitus sp. SFB-co]EIA31333.1 hypothetical protein SFBSU_002G63 [Candidatus Arthromitus sp. SFB-mouse-SU]EIA31573.1 hypothetical protein SFB4_009G5 [Candidatus Arthromitus sp. SFB-4]
MILTFKLDSNDTNGIKKLITLCENLLSFEETATPELEFVREEPKTDIKIDDLRNALIKLAKDKGKETAKELLNEFKVEKLTDVNTSDYDRLLQRIREVQ